jgi:hypothetical protein
MSNPLNILDLAQRFRRDAETTCMPQYAALMRLAAEELEAYSRLEEPSLDQREHQAPSRATPPAISLTP